MYRNRKQVRLTESQLHRVIAESVMRTLKEIKNGWELEDDDITLVNDDSMSDKLYIVKLWWGSGYQQDCYNAFANSAEEALEIVVAYIEQHNPEWLAAADENAEALKKELLEGNPEMDEYDVEELPEFAEMFQYVDATREGADSPHYIYSENLHIAEYPKGENHPMNPKARR